MAFGVSDEGFQLKRLADILADMKAALSTVQDPVTGQTLTVDLADENDPLVQIVNAVSDELAVAWEQLQIAYNAFDPQKAAGSSLSGLVQLNSIKKNKGEKAVAAFSFQGSPLKILTAGKRASTMDDSVIFEFPQVEFDALGDAVAFGTATEYGPVTLDIGTVVKILTPESGWDSVSNIEAIDSGSFEESDTDLRARRKVSTTIASSSVIDSTHGALLNVEGVVFARVYQNRTLVDDSRGIPGKSVSAVVLGGADQDIADQIFYKLPLGGNTYGNTLVIEVDNQGIQYPIYFFRPIEVPVFVELSITVTDSSSWPSNGIDLIKAAIVSYATLGASGVGIEEGFDQDGYVPGVSVYGSELYTPVNKQPGIKINSLFIGVVNPAVDNYVEILWNELAVFTADNINVTLV